MQKFNCNSKFELFLELRYEFLGYFYKNKSERLKLYFQATVWFFILKFSNIIDQTFFFSIILTLAIKVEGQLLEQIHCNEFIVGQVVQQNEMINLKFD